MTRGFAVAGFLLLAALALCGCTTLLTARAKPIPGPARGDTTHYVVVTLRNDWRVEAEHPGSTPRGYDAGGRYGVTGAARAEARALERQYGLHEVSAWPIATLHVHCIMFQFPGTTSRTTLIARLGGDRRVESVQPLNEFATESDSERPQADIPVEPTSLPYNDPYAKLQSSLLELSVADAQRLSRGAGVTVAVIDSGVDVDHPDLKGQVIAHRNFVDGNDESVQRDTHGTQVSGVIAALTGNGIGVASVAPDARLIALKACWQTAATAAAVCNSFTLAQALEAAIVAHADIVNLSLAGPTDPLLDRIIAVGASRGVIFVAAAGKPGTADMFPANLDSVLAVDAAEDRSGNPRHVQAPGRDVVTLVPGDHYDFASGSSLAAAEVSGVVALMIARRPHQSVAELRNTLLRTSRQVHSPAGEISVVDAHAALAAD